MTTLEPLALEIKGLHKIYGGGTEALRGIDLEVHSGEFFGLLGPNGAGKSTTIGIVTTLVNKTAGRVRIFGRDLDEDPVGAKRLLGVVPQEINFNQFERCEQILVQQAGYYGLARHHAIERAEVCLRSMDLWDKRAERSRDLSGGMKRRLMIARALVHDPKLLILDEPTAGVDIELRRATWKLLERINDSGTTVILTTHYLEEAESLCRRIAIIDHGQIVEDTETRELLARLAVETFVLDTAVPLESSPSLTMAFTRLRDDGSLEIDVERGVSLNDVFAELSRQGIVVESLRNKSNRLEELFVRLVAGDAGDRATVSANRSEPPS